MRGEKDEGETNVEPWEDNVELGEGPCEGDGNAVGTWW